MYWLVFYKLDGLYHKLVYTDYSEGVIQAFYRSEGIDPESEFLGFIANDTCTIERQNDSLKVIIT